MSVDVNRSLELPESEYFPELEAKSGIALHHTVCDDAHTTVSLWRDDRTADGNPRRVATAYVINYDGTVFELFDPAHWAFHLGVRWPYEQRVAFEKRMIGIEIASAAEFPSCALPLAPLAQQQAQAKMGLGGTGINRHDLAQCLLCVARLIVGGVKDGQVVERSDVTGTHLERLAIGALRLREAPEFLVDVAKARVCERIV